MTAGGLGIFLKYFGSLCNKNKFQVFIAFDGADECLKWSEWGEQDDDERSEWGEQDDDKRSVFTSDTDQPSEQVSKRSTILKYFSLRLTNPRVVQISIS